MTMMVECRFDDDDMFLTAGRYAKIYVEAGGAKLMFGKINVWAPYR